MRNKIICLLLALMMCFSVFALAACNKDNGDSGNEGGSNEGGSNEGGSNSGSNNGGSNSGSNNGGSNSGSNNGGSNSGVQRPNIGGGEKDESEWWKDIKYDTTDLIFQMTHCANQRELPSGCERYLAGESTDSDEIDTLVAQRNEDAYINTNVNVTYTYVKDDDALYGYSKNIDRIYEEVSKKTKNTPDMYCNFMTDMLCTSLKGSFANVYSKQHGKDDYAGANYFNTQDPGYMADLMASLTLDLDRIYVIASDYFLDLIRAFFVVPVNANLYNGIAKEMIEDYTGDGKQDINDFFEEIKEKKWNYDRVAAYAAKIYKPGSGNQSGNEQINDQLGFALGENGLPAAGMVYTSSVTIITKPWDPGATGYNYPKENPELDTLAKNLDKLFQKTGVKCITKDDAKAVGESTALLGLRKQFTSGKILFGGVILVGALEYSEYQDMKKNGKGGFGVVPVPTYREGDDYLTQIHVTGRAGGIAFSTSKFVQCSAFLQYQSSNSTDILNYYYDYNLAYDTASGYDGNVDMLMYIRENVRTSFDKLYEDAIGFFYEYRDPEAPNYRWHKLICDHRYQMTNMSDVYKSRVGQKQTDLDLLKKMYTTLPN